MEENRQRELEENKRKEDLNNKVAHIALIGQGKSIKERARTVVDLSNKLMELEYQYKTKGYNAIDVQKLIIELKRLKNIDIEQKLEAEEVFEIIDSLSEEELDSLIEQSGVEEIHKTPSLSDLDKFATIEKDYIPFIDGLLPKNNISNWQPWNRTKHCCLNKKHNNNYYRQHKRK